MLHTDKHIVVQVSPKRWVVAEPYRLGGYYRICTLSIHTAEEALKVANELNEVDARDLSEFTNKILLDS